MQTKKAKVTEVVVSLKEIEDLILRKAKAPAGASCQFNYYYVNDEPGRLDPAHRLRCAVVRWEK